MNPWIEHIKKFAIANKTNYSCSLANPYCLKTYKDKSLPLEENKIIYGSKRIVDKDLQRRINEDRNKLKREVRKMLNSNYTKQEIKDNKEMEIRLMKQREEQKNQPAFIFPIRKKQGVLF